jgi:hypothetical protein
MQKKVKAQSSLTARPQAANLEAPAPVKARPSASSAVDGKLLELAARGGEVDCHDAFYMFAGMSLEELRMARRAAWRFEEWCDSYLVGNGQEL